MYAIVKKIKNKSAYLVQGHLGHLELEAGSHGLHNKAVQSGQLKMGHHLVNSTPNCTEKVHASDKMYTRTTRRSATTKRNMLTDGKCGGTLSKDFLASKGQQGATIEYG